jgi:glycosyltransferase involved in cell wall biosynthesis
MEGVRQRGLRLKELGHTVEVVTLDDPGHPYVGEYPLTVHALGPSRTGYGYNVKLVPWLKANARGYDTVIVNGIWQYHSFAAWRALKGMGVPYYVFTHGMLDPWFKRAYPVKHLKKWLYWPWADYRVLRDARAVLFTSEEERLQARQSFWLYRAAERVVAYGTSAPPADAANLREIFLAAHPSLRGKRLILYLSRLHEKKGCDLLLRAFARLATAKNEWHLVMAGPDETGVGVRLKNLTQALGLTDRVTWPGMLRGDLKWGAFYSAEVFALPSHQENFGIAVAEALSCGLPVLISDKVNIWREIESDQAGLVEEDTQSGTDNLLRRWLAAAPESRARMRDNAKRSFTRRFTVDAMATSLLDVVSAAP